MKYVNAKEADTAIWPVHPIHLLFLVTLMIDLICSVTKPKTYFLLSVSCCFGPWHLVLNDPLP